MSVYENGRVRILIKLRCFIFVRNVLIEVWFLNIMLFYENLERICEWILLKWWLIVYLWVII